MRTRRQRVLRACGWALLALALLALGHRCAMKGGDFLAFYDVGEAALRHGDIYAFGPRMQMHVAYVPYFALGVAPLALLPPYAAAWIWYLLKLGAVLVLGRWIDRAVRAEAPGLSPRARWAYLVLPFLVLFNPWMSEFRLGQSNLFVLLFCLLTVRALQRGRPVLAAFLYSLAVIKVTALALLPWFALRRQWRFFLAALPVGAFWLAMLAAWWGPSNVPGLFVEWVTSTARNRAGYEAVAYFENQSLQGATARLALLAPALHRPVAGLPAYQWLWIVPCLAILGLLVLTAARDRFRAHLPAEEFGLASLLMLLASSDSRYAHHLQLLVPVAVLVALAARTGALETLPRVGAWLAAGGAPAPQDEAARRLRRTALALLAATFAFYVLLGRDTFGPAVNHAVRMASLGTALDLVLVGWLALRLLRRGPGPAGAPATSLAAAPIAPHAG